MVTVPSLFKRIKIKRILFQDRKFSHSASVSLNEREKRKLNEFAFHTRIFKQSTFMYNLKNGVTLLDSLTVQQKLVMHTNANIKNICNYGMRSPKHSSVRAAFHRISCYMVPRKFLWYGYPSATSTHQTPYKRKYQRYWLEQSISLLKYSST